MKLNVSSETGQLEAVVVHTPGHEVSLVNPELKDELLFDDIIFEDDARQQHLDMLRMFQVAMPEQGNIFEITDLFLECFQHEEAKHTFVENMIERLPEENLHTIQRELVNLPSGELLRFVIDGTTPAIKGFSLLPTPNLLFTRDLAAVVNDSIILSRPAKKARIREALLVENMVQYHPLFSDLKSSTIKIADQESIEGGDVVVASREVVLIGMSERTSFSGLMSTTKALLNHGVKHVLAVDIPKQRSSMHLDTIFTFASDTECVGFPPAITERKNNVVALSKRNDSIHAQSMPSLQEALEVLMEKKLTFINCGGNIRTNQFREQWTDGANVFALAPGIIVGYERNTNTFHALEEHGYQLMNQYEFIEKFEDHKFDPSKNKIAISFLGHELCRGRGGARCMTMPIARAT